MHKAAPTPPDRPLSEANYPTSHPATYADAQRQPPDVCHVGEGRHSSAGPVMTDADWKAAIVRANAAWAKHHFEWLLTGGPTARGNADRAWLLREQLAAKREAAA